MADVNCLFSRYNPAPPIIGDRAMSDSQERRRKGAKVFGEVYKGVLSADPDNPTGDDFFDLMIENLFGEVWTREALSLRDRRLITMGLIAALGETDTFEIQVLTALNTGHLTIEQIREIIIHLTQYIGYPRTTGMRAAAEKGIHQWQKNQQSEES
jgi:4-carboxymuconolactone decarboxylase